MWSSSIFFKFRLSSIFKNWGRLPFLKILRSSSIFEKNGGLIPLLKKLRSSSIFDKYEVVFHLLRLWIVYTQIFTTLGRPLLQEIRWGFLFFLSPRESFGLGWEFDKKKEKKKERKREKKELIEATMFYLKRPRAVHALRSDRIKIARNNFFLQSKIGLEFLSNIWILF